MSISVNGVEITDSAIERELPRHRQAKHPIKQALDELVLRTLLLQEAERLGIAAESDDARIEALLARELRVPQPDESACLTFYRNQPALFTQGELVEARHILFQVTPSVPLDLLRETGEAILAELRARPERFGELAHKYSNCPSGRDGGKLGPLVRGQTVPEFEDFVFRLAEGEMGKGLLETRFGLHIVQATRRVEGTLLPFDLVRAQIADRLGTQSWQRAVHQYLKILVGRADLQGVTLEAADTPLVQ